ncbi:MAG: hypothetical protein AAF558_07960 [Verrucomicrobiota bacterium]
MKNNVLKRQACLVARQFEIMGWVLGWSELNHSFSGEAFLNKSVQVFEDYLEHN